VESCRLSRVVRRACLLAGAMIPPVKATESEGHEGHWCRRGCQPLTAAIPPAPAQEVCEPEDLGDSFDIVKRFWAERLAPIAPLVAHGFFVPVELRQAFSGMVGMPILEAGSPPNSACSSIPTPVFRCRHLGPNRSPSPTVPSPSSWKSSNVGALDASFVSTRASPGAPTRRPSES